MSEHDELPNFETLLPEDTVDVLSRAPAERVARELCVTVLFHPDLRRVGERALPVKGGRGRAFEISRATLFATPGGEPSPLADPFVSRRPVEITTSRRGVVVRPPEKSSLVIDGKKVTEALNISTDDLEVGVSMELSKRVDLLLHRVGTGARAPHHDLVGESDGIEETRRAVSRVADLNVPVLVRGETGVGKERVAQATHRASGSAGPWVSVNMATLSPHMAASELFGHMKGAFTGAGTTHQGLFERANGGTLFLDEIGETPDEVQSMLLRTLETGTILPIGAERERNVSVRVITATDLDLDEAVELGSFRAALLHRLSSYVVWIPPLRERREDIPLLTLHFLREELDRVGELQRLRPGSPKQRPWFPRSLMSALMRFDWPGNVRQLRNVVRQLVISNRGADVLSLDRQLQRLLRGESRSEVAKPAPNASEIGEEQLIEALKQSSWSFGAAARALGLSRAAFYRLADKTPRVRKSSEIGAEEFEQCFEECEGDVAAMSDRLCVSPRGIKLRLTELGIKREN